MVRFSGVPAEDVAHGDRRRQRHGDLRRNRLRRASAWSSGSCWAARSAARSSRSASSRPALLLQDGWRFAFFAAGQGHKAFVNDMVWAVAHDPAADASPPSSAPSSASCSPGAARRVAAGVRLAAEQDPAAPRRLARVAAQTPGPRLAVPGRERQQQRRRPAADVRRRRDRRTRRRRRGPRRRAAARPVPGAAHGTEPGRRAGGRPGAAPRAAPAGSSSAWCSAASRRSPRSCWGMALLFLVPDALGASCCTTSGHRRRADRAGDAVGDVRRASSPVRPPDCGRWVRRREACGPSWSLRPVTSAAASPGRSSPAPSELAGVSAIAMLGAAACGGYSCAPDCGTTPRHCRGRTRPSTRRCRRHQASG